MLAEESDAALLHDMLHAAHAVMRYVSQKTNEAFLADEMLRDAVERRIEIIGEAARGVSSELRDAHPEIPWAKITTTRHILAHGYGEVDPNIIWRVATVYVPELIGLLEPLIPPPPPDPEPED